MAFTGQEEIEGGKQPDLIMGTPLTSPRQRGPNLTWPIILITLGVLFLVDQFVPGWGIRRTWPVLLVLIGVLKLLDSTRPPRPPAGPR
jgi:hypothetical protein